MDVYALVIMFGSLGMTVWHLDFFFFFFARVHLSRMIDLRFFFFSFFFSLSLERHVIISTRMC
jgi:hypothetical protein